MKLDQDMIIACTRCTCKVPIASTTYDKTGKKLICFECYNKISKGIEPEKYRTIQSENPEKVGYKCVSCGYRFSRNSTFQFGGICFNCGKNTVQIEETRQMILKEGKTLLDY